jgi:hypothetical protein
MKALKKLALLTALSLVGAAVMAVSAAATIVTGPNQTVYVGEIGARSTAAVFDMAGQRVTCRSTTTGSVNGNTYTGTLSTLTFANCTGPFSSPCTVTVSGLPRTVTLTKASDTLTVSGPITVTITCLNKAFICTVSAASATLQVISGKPARLVANRVPLRRVGGNCSEPITWDATYTITNPTTLHHL